VAPKSGRKEAKKLARGRGVRPLRVKGTALSVGKSRWQKKSSKAVEKAVGTRHAAYKAEPLTGAVSRLGENTRAPAMLGWRVLANWTEARKLVDAEKRKITFRNVLV